MRRSGCERSLRNDERLVGVGTCPRGKRTIMRHYKSLGNTTGWRGFDDSTLEVHSCEDKREPASYPEILRATYCFSKHRFPTN